MRVCIVNNHLHLIKILKVKNLMKNIIHDDMQEKQKLVRKSNHSTSSKWMRFYFPYCLLLSMYNLNSKGDFSMEANQKSPFLYFNFIDHQGIYKPLQFSNPIKILTAQTTNEIMPCMIALQQAVEKGFYAAGYISYEAAPAFDKELQVKTGNTMPLLWFGIFNEPIHQPLNYKDLNNEDT